MKVGNRSGGVEHEAFNEAEVKNGSICASHLCTRKLNKRGAGQKITYANIFRLVCSNIDNTKSGSKMEYYVTDKPYDEEHLTTKEHMYINKPGSPSPLGTDIIWQR